MLIPAVLLLNACVLSAEPTTTKPPRPQAGSVEGSAQADLAGVFGVYIEPPSGAARPLAKLIAEQIMRELQARNIPATTTLAGDRRYRWVGQAHLNRDRADLDFIAVIDWRLEAKDGRLLASYPQGVEASRLHWSYGDPSMVARIGERAGEKLVTLLRGDPDFPTAPIRREPKFYVASVLGAPGDGNESLARAIALALPGGGAGVATLAEAAAYRLSASVALSPPVGGTQKILITWRVTDWQGRDLGSATQVNQVRRGSLQGAWGGTADQVAIAAVDGIKDIILRRGLPLARPEIGR